mmetsp:Transcript_91271/g.199939  ORF Transcript_91271/g.199939 Transcript_91271/m.199939 type:complete len:482 (+) Transcript_91271:128-1573(+)
MVASAEVQSPLLHPDRVPEPGKFVENLGVFSLDGPVIPILRPLEAAPLDVLNFSDVSRPEVVRDLCHKNVPGWSAYSKEKIAIDQICEGLSNQLFKVHIDVAASGVIPCVLFRIYGRDVATLYDQEQELDIFRTLSKYQIAPKMYANGDGWRIEEWHFAVALKTQHMRNPSILCQVASQLGRFHKLSARADFPRNILELPPASIQRLDRWAAGCGRAAANLEAEGCMESHRRLIAMNIPEMVAEREWLKKFVLEGDDKLKGSGLDIVFSHNDCQENNILQTHYGLRFIDFEYSNMDYQSYDIANYFCECTLDYCWDKYPFYSHRLSDFPTEWEQRLFCAIYLSEYLESKVKPEESAVTILVGRVRRFVLMSHYLWAVWSVIRAPQACTFNEFDFLHYAQARWDTYKRDKRALLEAGDSRPRFGTDDVGVGGSSGNRKASFSWQQRTKKETQQSYMMGGALTASGVLLGVMAVVAVNRLARR